MSWTSFKLTQLFSTLPHPTYTVRMKTSLQSGVYLYKAKLQSVGVFLHPPLIVRLTYGTFRGSLSPT
jgi:hypothetical protein